MDGKAENADGERKCLECVSVTVDFCQTWCILIIHACEDPTGMLIQIHPLFSNFDSVSYFQPGQQQAGSNL